MASTAASGLTARARDSSAAESNNNGISPYEQFRLDNIARNEDRLASLGLLGNNGTSASTALLAPPNNAPAARRSKRLGKKNGGADEPPAGVTSGTGAEADLNSIASRLNSQTRKRAGPGSFTQLLDGWTADGRGWSEGGVSGDGHKKAGKGGNSRRGRGPKKAGNGSKTAVAVKGPKTHKGPRTRSKTTYPKDERILSNGKSGRTYNKKGHAAVKATGRKCVSSGGGLHEHNRRNGKVLWERLQDILNNHPYKDKMFGRCKGAAGKKGNFWCKGEDWNDFAILLKVLGNASCGAKPGSMLRKLLTHDTQSTWKKSGPPFRELKAQKEMQPHSKAFKEATLVFRRTANKSPSLM